MSDGVSGVTAHLHLPPPPASSVVVSHSSLSLMSKSKQLKAPDINTIETAHPFQVSGHGALLKLPDGKVCKPLIDREVAFYQNMDKHPGMIPFMAPFYGIIEITFPKERVEHWIQDIERKQEQTTHQQQEQQREGQKSQKEDEPQVIMSQTQPQQQGKSKTLADTKRLQQQDELEELEIPAKKTKNGEEYRGHEATEQELSTNPWSLTVTKRNFTNLLKKHNESVFLARYLVMGDLTSKYKHPCICDIKIGTRQHGDDADPDKKRRHIRKVATTTSSQVGIRLCGQLVWLPTRKMYRHIDKYEGRKMSTDHLVTTMTQFFLDGDDFNFAVLAIFIEKLKNLLDVIKNEVSYRFYSTSLLLLYEGDEEARKQEYQEVDVKMIDFAHTFPFLEGEENDDGYIYGMTHLINMLGEIYAEQKRIRQVDV